MRPLLIAALALLTFPAAALAPPGQDRVGLWLFGPPRYTEGETRTVAVTMVNEGPSHLLLEKVVVTGALRAMADWSEPSRFGRISYQPADDSFLYDPRPAETTGRLVRGGLLAPGRRAEKELAAYAVGGGSGTVRVILTVQRLSPDELEERFYFRVSSAPEVYRRSPDASGDFFIVRSTAPFAREPRAVEISATVAVRAKD